MGELEVDFFATEEQREKQVAALANDEEEMYEKRLLCKEYCGKFSDHIGLMRKDLLSLVDNEDAVMIHEELKGITDVMRLFHIGLDQSVMNEPTQINLSDWANLCLFRLAIVRRRISAIKIYIDKTGSAEALLKIEAFLFCIFEFLNTGEIDEYEMQTIDEEPFFDVGFLMQQSSIADPTLDTPVVEKPRPKKASTASKAKKEEAIVSEETKQKEEEEEPATPEPEASEEISKGKDESVATETEDEPMPLSKTNSLASEAESAIEEEEDQSRDQGEATDDQTNETKDEPSNAPETTTPADESSVPVSEAKEEEEEKEQPAEEEKEAPEEAKEESKEETKKEEKEDAPAEVTPVESKEEPTEEKKEEVEEEDFTPEPSSSSKSKKSKREKKTKIRAPDEETATPPGEPEQPVAQDRSSPLTPLKSRLSRFGLSRKKKSTTHSDSPSLGPVRSVSGNHRDGRSPLVTKKKDVPTKKVRSTSAFSVKRRHLEPSMAPPLIRGQLEITSTRRISWKTRWVIFNNEKLELYRDDTCLSLHRAYMVTLMQSIRIEDTSSQAEDAAEDEKNKKKKNTTRPFCFIVELPGETLSFATTSRMELLQWVIGISATYSKILPDKPAIYPDTPQLVQELCMEQYEDQSALKKDEEQWIYAAGMLMLVGSPIKYMWNGLTCTHTAGDNLGSFTWNGATLTLQREGHPDMVCNWIECTKEFHSAEVDEDGESKAAWVWRTDRFLMIRSPQFDEQSKKPWKSLRPVAPAVAMIVACLSSLNNGKAIIPEAAEVEGQSIQERRAARTAKKKPKRRKSFRRSNSKISKTKQISHPEKEEAATKDEAPAS